MHFSLLTGLALALATGISAQDPYYRKQSKPFNLVISSSERGINNTYLYACLEGTDIHALCFTRTEMPEFTRFTLNYTDVDNPVPGYGNVGLITWKESNQNTSMSLGLETHPLSNVAIPLFRPGDRGFTHFGFDYFNMMFAGGFQHDSVSPALKKFLPYYRWQVCVTDAGLELTTLAWVVGHGRADNPTCIPIVVSRVFV
ncbi:hypothetical protein PZA11_006636 [Diplocarpon coronariae]